MSLVSIVILNWNGKRFLQEFLPVLVRNSDLPDGEIVIADNGSSDDSVEFLKNEWPEIRVIRDFRELMESLVTKDSRVSKV